MLWTTVLMSVLLLLVAKFPLSSEPFLLGVLGTCFILVGNGIRQRGLKDRRKKQDASTETAKIASPAIANLTVSISAPKIARLERPESRDGRFAHSTASHSPSAAQLRLPLHGYELKDAGAPVFPQ
jgi:hypothetical protein